MTKLKSCPVCKKPLVAEFAPFCSRYCQNRDLLSWMNEGYRIPVPAESHSESEVEFRDDEDEQ